eukprot:UN04839
MYGHLVGYSGTMYNGTWKFVALCQVLVGCHLPNTKGKAGAFTYNWDYQKQKCTGFVYHVPGVGDWKWTKNWLNYILKKALKTIAK